jgi:hypothetical protein
MIKATEMNKEQIIMQYLSQLEKKGMCYGAFKSKADAGRALRKGF